MALTVLLALALLGPTPVSPCLAQAQESADGADPPTLRVIALGDDYSFVSRSNPRPWPTRLQELLSQRLPGTRVEVENEAFPGATSVTALHRLRRDVLDRDPDVVVVQLGAADAEVDLPRGEDFPRVAPGAFRSNLMDLVSTVQGAGATVVLVEPAAVVWTDALRESFGDAPYDPLDPWGFDRLLEAYAGVVSDVSSELRVPLVATHQADRLRGADTVAQWRTEGRLGNADAHTWQARSLADVVVREATADGFRIRALSQHRAPSRGWTIPEIDFAGDAERVIVVDREEGQYLGHPSSVLLADGRTILCAYPKGHGRGAVVLKRSDDGGRTWSERLAVPDSWASSRETPTLFRIPPKGGGRENLVMWSGLHPARRALSRDDGTTWGELEIADPATPWGGIVVMGDQAQLADGSTAAWFHDDGRFFLPTGRARGGNPRGAFAVYQTTTEDGGVTWTDPREIVRWPHGHLCEPGFVRQGPALALLLRENSRKRNSQLILSRDEGETWSPPLALSGALTGDRHQVLRLPDGRLFISFRDMGLASPRRGDWVAWVGTFEDVVLGRQGELRLRLMDNLVGTDCAYPALELVDDPETGPTIVAVTYGHWTAGAEPWIACLRIDTDELRLPAARSGSDGR